MHGLWGTFGGATFAKPVGLTVTARQRLPFLLRRLTRARLLRVLCPFASRRAVLSLRELEWFVINYAKRLRLAGRARGEVYPVYDTYLRWRQRWGQAMFDLYARRGSVPVRFEFAGKRYATSVAQLNFLYMAETHGVLALALAHTPAVKREHSARMSKCRALKRAAKERDQTVRFIHAPLAPTVCAVYDTPVRVQFQRHVDKDATNNNPKQRRPREPPAARGQTPDAA